MSDTGNITITVYFAIGKIGNFKDKTLFKE